MQFSDDKTKSIYSDNKKYSVGEKCRCPVCGTVFTKTQYSQAFCCSSCKNMYHNHFNKERHRPGYYRYYDELHRERKERQKEFWNRVKLENSTVNYNYTKFE